MATIETDRMTSPSSENLSIHEMFKEQLCEFSDRKPTWSTEQDGLRLQLWRGRWEEFFMGFRIRVRFFKVAAGERLVAAGRFFEWADAGETDLDSFSFATDSMDGDAYEMGLAMFRSFCEAERKTFETPFDYGRLVVFDRVRIIAATAQESKSVWALIRNIIARFRREPVAGVVLKAFPFARRGQSDEHFERAKRAMMRRYINQLGVVTLPGEPGDDGWQWLALKCDLEPAASSRKPQWHL